MMDIPLNPLQHRVVVQESRVKIDIRVLYDFRASQVSKYIRAMIRIHDYIVISVVNV